ncbi:unnamed protein product, partial [Symbiodinium sp. KB8]
MRGRRALFGARLIKLGTVAVMSIAEMFYKWVFILCILLLFWLATIAMLQCVEDDCITWSVLLMVLCVAMGGVFILEQHYPLRFGMKIVSLKHKFK